ncbi:esterase/lipase family protein [Actinomadura chokoriensis]|uniref:Alpha/beta fold hydrolase n=1 Tax=Actinomadura chokoriensis TaxID=454156 RepID=A0ABV4QUV8_9ACTN
MRLAVTLLALVLALGFAAPARADVEIPPPPPTSDSPPDAPVPGPLPAGVNDWNCRSASRPVPLILVHGTWGNALVNWFATVPALKAAGHCVYAFNYGGAPNGVVQGTGDIRVSAQQLAAFVREVRSATGAAKVDLVGHSQGGMMPRYYLKNLGGAQYVRHLVGIAPSNDGTDVWGLTRLAKAYGIVDLGGYVCYSCYQQVRGSEFLTELNAGGQTEPGVEYTVIATKYDEIVTPYRSSFLTGDGVHNILVQDVCPNEISEHGLIVASPVTRQLVTNALAPAGERKPVRCLF